MSLKVIVSFTVMLFIDDKWSITQGPRITIEMGAITADQAVPGNVIIPG